MITRLLLAIVFFLVSVPFAVSQSTLNERLSAPFQAPMALLRPVVVVTSDLVTLGDLFDYAGQHAETPVFRAPAPGTRGRVPSYAVLEAAHAAGLVRLDLAGLAEITVERAGVLLSTIDLQDLVRDELNVHLSAQMGEQAGSYTLTLVRQPTPAMVGAEIAETLVVDLIVAPTARSPRFAALVRTPSGEEIARMDGRAEHFIMVPVLGRAVGRGDVIRPSDLRLQEIAYARTIGTPTLIDTADIVGQAARRSLRAGAPLNPDDLSAPLMVERQDLVTLVYRHGALALTVRARALDDGSEGQSIDVMNLQSDRVVRGVVAGHGLVHVLGPMQEVAASLAVSLPTPATTERIQ